jgi:ribose transport system ATP-binding protein
MIAQSSEPALLSVRKLSKHFGGITALQSVDIDFHAAEVHALLGENGAGKSTLIKILAGVHRQDGGDVLWRGKPEHPAQERLPIVFIHQDLGLVEEMTVGENIGLVAGYPMRRCAIDWAAVDRRAADLLERMGGGISPDARLGSLNAAAKSIVAIARALAVRTDFLVLDEPTAALPESDVARLLGVLHRVKQDGVGIIYVTHRLDEVFRVADRVTILRDGRKIATSAVSETSPRALVHAIVGRELEQQSPPPEPASREPVLEIEELAAGHVGPVSFTLARGEILGLVGLRGAGHDAVGRMLFGATPFESGQVRLDGRVVDLSKPRAASDAGIGFVSSKRREENLAPSLTVRENLFMNPALVERGGMRPIWRRGEIARSLAVLKRVSVRPMDSERTVLTLSGGNQQKVVLSRWIEANRRVLVLEEPTIGVDVGSKAEIYDLIGDALTTGLSVLLVSSDFEEVARICHRALVFDRGRIRLTLRDHEISVARLIEAASAGARVPAA